MCPRASIVLHCALFHESTTTGTKLVVLVVLVVPVVRGRAVAHLFDLVTEQGVWISAWQ
jgi:hypothetical protein